MIPIAIKDSIDRYVSDGVPTGGFLRAVLCHDLFEAVARADEDSRIALCEIGNYIHARIPSGGHGSLVKDDAWLEYHAVRREKANA